MELQGRLGSVASVLKGFLFKNPKRKRKKWSEDKSAFKGWKRKEKESKSRWFRQMHLQLQMYKAENTFHTAFSNAKDQSFEKNG